MRVLEAIRERRSIRSFKPDDITGDVLARLFEAIRLAPSAVNRQPLRFIVVRDRETRRKIALACRCASPKGQKTTLDWVGEAPVVVVPCGSEAEAALGYQRDGELVISNGRVWQEMQIREGYESALQWDLAIALDHLSLAAVDEGLGTCWIGCLNEREIKEILGVPDGWRVQLLMAIGYPVGWPEPRPRKSIQEIICFEQFGQR